MKLALVVLLAVGCGSGTQSAPPATVSSSAPASKRANVPAVRSASLLATPVGRLPMLLVIDDAGAVHVAAVASLADLGTRDPLDGAKRVPLEAGAMFARETFAMGRDAVEAFRGFDAKEYARLNGELGDDPPPPPEEDEIDDEGRENTEWGLEEGKLGTPKRDPKVMRELEQVNFAVTGFPGGLWPRRGRDPREPARAASFAGLFVKTLPEQRALVVASPRAKASVVIAAIELTLGAIVVVHGKDVRPLRLGFLFPEDGTIRGELFPKWLEARISKRGVTIEAVPEVPVDIAWANGPLDAEALKAALDKARKSRGLDPLAPVDVLVDADVDAQRLVDALEALEQAGVRMVGIGNALNAEQAKRRGKRIPIVTHGQINTVGYPKADIQRAMRDNEAKLQACYESALAKLPGLEGALMAVFTITPTGKTAGPSVSGVDPALATCFAGAINTIVFPKPKYGTIKVEYSFKLRS